MEASSVNLLNRWRHPELMSENLRDSELPSCDPAYSRKEFFALVIKRAGVAGAIICAPKIVDKFFLPPAEARMIRTSTRLRTEA
jgi:hypothetical protein